MSPRRRTPAELAAEREAAAELAERLTDGGWPCSAGWVRAVLLEEAGGRVDLLAAAIAELVGCDALHRARIAGKSPAYIRGALRRAVRDRARRPGQSTPAPRPTRQPETTPPN